jgi:hypothetical protein
MSSRRPRSLAVPVRTPRKRAPSTTPLPRKKPAMDSLQEILVAASKSKVFDAWTTRDGLRAWWTDDLTVPRKAGDNYLRLRRGPRGLSLSCCRRDARRANAVDRRRRGEHARGMGGYRNRSTAFTRTGRQDSVAIRAPELAVNRRCILRMQHNVGGNSFIDFATLARVSRVEHCSVATLEYVSRLAR